MRKKIDKNAEFDHFNQLSNEWWNPNGKFKILHTLTPLRIEYIKSNFNTAMSFHNSDDQLAKMISKVVYKKDYKL